MADSDQTSIILAITGGIGCGKSEVGRILTREGFDLCDADLVAHDLMKNGTGLFQQLVSYFGKRIVGKDGDLNRAELGKIVFNNKEELQALNGMVHPAVRAVLEEWIDQHRKDGRDGAVQIPLLFESRMEDLDWNAVICVVSDQDKVIERLGKRGLSEADAFTRIKSQLPADEKAARSDRVIQNNGTLEDLEKFIKKTAQNIRAER